MPFQFKKLKSEYLETVLRWRSDTTISRYLFTDIPYDMEKQKAWFSKISNDESCNYWVICFETDPIGLIWIDKVSRQHNYGYMGYYLGNYQYKGKGFGSKIPPYYCNYILKHLGLNKIIAEVMEGNSIMMHILLKHGFVKVGVYKAHLFKYSLYHDMHIFELTQDDWLAQNKYNDFIAEFEH